MRNLSLLAFVALVGCGGQISEPSTLHVDTTVSAATLADDCSSSGGVASSDAGGFAPSDGDCAPGKSPCGGWCQQSNMQLAVSATGTGSGSFEVVTVRLYDAKTGDKLDEGSAKNARFWDGAAYVGWTPPQIDAGKTLKVSYDLTKFDWTRIGAGNPWSTYGRRFLIEVVVRISGVERTVRSGELSREPEVAT